MAGTGDVIIQGPTGINTVTTWTSYTLPDNIQNLSVSGDGLYAAGNSLDNLITVGDTNAMQLYGAGGNNVLVGGAGTDTFVIDGTAGSNAIYNWHSGDQLRLLGANFTTFAQVQAAMTQVGSDVVLQNGLNDLVIRNTTISQFQASDFYIGLDKTKLGQATFDDEFNSLSLHNAANPTGTWTPNYWYGGLGAYTLDGNGELQLYTAPGFTGTGTTDLGLNPFSISNGVLDIHAQTVTPEQSAAMWNYGYSSGVITTHDSFAQTYGYFEMRAELPTDVSGAWPAFWLVPADGSWPPELDVMETLTGQSNVDYTTEHSFATGSHTAVGSANLVTDVGGFHTYGVLWTASTLTWYLDGQAVFQTATPADMNKPMYMIANLAVGGWAATPNFASTDMYVDYIRAYALADGSSSWTSIVTPDAQDPNLAGNIASSSVLLTPAPSSASSTPTPAPTTTSGSAVTVSDAVYTAPDGVTDITLASSGQTVTGNNAGDTFHSNNSLNTLIGGTGDDTFHLGRGGDVVTGGGGNDTFAFAEMPWNGGHIGDFGADDVLDLSAMFARYGYIGATPVADGYLKITDDGHGDAQVWAQYATSGSNAGWLLVETLAGVSSANLTTSGDSVVWGIGPSSGGSAVSTSDADYTAPDGVTTITLTGSNQTIHANNSGDVIWSDNSQNILIGGTGADILHIGRAGDTVTGGGGNDTFAYAEVPWGGSTIADFQSGDVIDLTGLMHTTHDTGMDGFADGYLKIASDGAGDAQVWANYNLAGNDSWWLVATLNGVAAGSLHTQGNVISSALAPLPPTPPSAPAGLALASIANGYVNGAADVAGQSLTGVAAAGAAVTVYDGQIAIGSATADAGGTWSLTLGVLADGAHSLTAVAAGASGAVSSASAPLAFVVDTLAPDAPAALSDAAAVKGYVNAGANVAGQTLTGSAEAGALVTVWDGSTIAGTAMASAGGQWSLVVGQLADGAHTFTAAATDAAGNLGPASAALAFTVDTVAPVPLVSNVVAVSGGAVISGQTEAGASVSILDNGKVVGAVAANASGAWSYTAAIAGSGVHSFTETATDAAGNASASPGVALYSSKTGAALIGGAGADVLVGRGGDTLTGGAGSDHFVFNGAFGKQTVTDFVAGAPTAAGDQVWIDHAFLADFAHLMADAKQVGADVTITVDRADVLTLHNVTLAGLHSSDFLFF